MDQHYQDMASISQEPISSAACGGLFENKTISHGIKIIIQDLKEQHILLRKDSEGRETGEESTKKENKKTDKG